MLFYSILYFAILSYAILCYDYTILYYIILVFAKQVNSTLRVLWLDNKKYISTAIYFLAFMRDGTRAFFQIQGIFHYYF